MDKIYNELNVKQEQKIINMCECMRMNNIFSTKFKNDDDELTYYLTGVDTMELNVKRIQNEGNICTIYADSYIIDKCNYISFQVSTKEILLINSN